MTIRMFQLGATALAAVLCFSLTMSPWAWGDDEEEKALPSNHEKVVDFLWLENGNLYQDRFTARVSPYLLAKGDKARLSIKIRRTKNDQGINAPVPIRIEIQVRRQDGGDHKTYSEENPGSSLSKSHTFKKSGEYVVSFITYYTEDDTRTVAVRFEVERP